MRLLSYPVTLILFATISLATPPPGYVKRPNDDKDPPKYQYRYAIGDENGKEVQGKMETRLGELASGRYFVNGEKYSTDVKYYVDEWGYHPLVKYRAVNDHSVATAHFAHGEHVVKSLLNGSEIGEEIKLPSLKGQDNQLHQKPLLANRRRPHVQVIQPYTPILDDINTSASVVNEGATSSDIHESQSMDNLDISRNPKGATSDDSLSLNYDVQRTSLPNSGQHNGVSSTTNFQQHFNNYVTLPKLHQESIAKSNVPLINDLDHQRQKNYPLSFVSTTSMPNDQSFPQTNIYPTNPSTQSSLSMENVNAHHENHLRNGHETSNDLFSTISDDVLVVQNAGSFGRRLNPTAPSIIHGISIESKTQRNLASSTSKSSYEISTSQPILRISEATNKPVENGASSYASYSTSVTTPQPTTIAYSTLRSNDDGHFITTAIPNFHEIQNSVNAEVSSNDYKKTVNDNSHGDNAVSGAYAGIFAKIYPNGQTNHLTGENINSLASGNSQLLHYDRDDNIESSTRKPDRKTTPGLLAYGKKLNHQLYVTLRQSLDTELKNLQNIHSSTSSAVSKFSSKPIVVAELSNYNVDEGFEYSTTVPCNEEQESSTILPSLSSTHSSLLLENESETVLVTPKLHSSHNHILTTSSVILNPIQAGVRLVNAGETELISIDDNFDRSPSPVNERIENESQMRGMKNDQSENVKESGNISREEARSELYEMINPAFGQSEFGMGGIDESIGINVNAENAESVNVGLLDGNTEDQQIEIQKTVAIYENAPVHKIRYLPQVITHESGINHHQQKQQQQQQQQQRELNEQQQQQYELNEQQQQNIAGLLHQRDEAKGLEEIHGSYIKLEDVMNAKQFHSPQLMYDVDEHETKHESHGTQLSLNKNREGSSDEETAAYNGNVVRHDNELVDYSIEGNKENPELLSGQEDSADIIKLIRENIPEVKYTAAETPRISVNVYPTIVQGDRNEEFIEKQQEVADLRGESDKVEINAEEHAKKVQSQLQRILSQSESVQRYFSGDEWTRLQAQRQQQEQEQQQQQQQLQQQQQQQQQQQREQEQQHLQQQQEQQREQEQQHLQQQQEQQREQEQQHLQKQQQQQRGQEQQQHLQQHQQQKQQQLLQQQHHQQQQQLEQQQQQQQEQQRQLKQQQKQQKLQQQQQLQQLHYHQQKHQTIGLSENHGNYRVHENVDDASLPKVQHQEQSSVVPWTQLYNVPSVKNLQAGLGNLVEEISSISHSVHKAHPTASTGTRIVEKTIHVPQPYPIEVPRIIEKKVPYPVEKIVERKVPYPVEKIIEKKIPVPQPYPVHIQVPVDRIVEKQVEILQPYPVHIEKIIEKKIPYPVQRLVPQPYPVHIIQPYPIEKIVEKPVHVPVTIEKIVEKKIHVPQPYPVQVPIKVPYPVEITKYVEQSVEVPYAVRYGMNYQQITKPQSSKAPYENQSSVSVPLYDLSLVKSENRQRERPNVNQNFEGYNYDKPKIPFVTGRVETTSGDQEKSNGWEQFAHGKSSELDNHQRHQTFSKKSYVGYNSKLPSLNQPVYNYSGLNRRHASYRQSNGPVDEQSIVKEKYFGPVPLMKQNVQQQLMRPRNSSEQQQLQLLKQQNSIGVPSASSSSSSSTLSTSLRRSRQQDDTSHYQNGPGAFRQSKIEYGFKPPMVPSIQYDEKMAAKVEN